MGALSSAGRRRLLAVWSVALLVAACGSGGDDDTRPIAISDAFALATVAAQPNGAVYFTITSATDDTLERASVVDSIADHVELHEAVATSTGEMGMQEVTSGVALGAGEAVTFTPGGKHVMLVGLVQPLVPGQTFEITLEFAEAAAITVPVAVVESAG